MVTQEGEPPLRGRSTSLDYVLGDAGLSDLKAELEQLAVDARRVPQRVGCALTPKLESDLDQGLITSYLL